VNTCSFCFCGKTALYCFILCVLCLVTVGCMPKLWNHSDKKQHQEFWHHYQIQTWWSIIHQYHCYYCIFSVFSPDWWLDVSSSFGFMSSVSAVASENSHMQLVLNRISVNILLLRSLGWLNGILTVCKIQQLLQAFLCDTETECWE